MTSSERSRDRPRRAPLGWQILFWSGWVLLLGSVATALFRYLVLGRTPKSPDAWTWGMGFAIPLAVLAEVTAILVVSGRRAGRFRVRNWRRRATRKSLRSWLGACALAAAGLGMYAGLLHDEPGPQIAYLVLVPVAVLAATLGTNWRQFLPRLACLVVVLELTVQPTATYAKFGRVTYWDDITAWHLGYLLGGLTFAFLQAGIAGFLRRRRYLRRVTRIRARHGIEPPDPRPVP